MNIETTIKFFENLIIETDKKSEIKTYKNFIEILIDLKDRDLAEVKMKSIETELDKLDLKANSEIRIKHLRRKLASFINYLKEELSLISKGYYTAIGMSLGLCFGVALGSSVFGGSLDNSSGLVIGMVVGMGIGRIMDTKAEKEGRVLKTNIH